MRDLAPYWQNSIGGKWVDGGAERIAVTDPATGEGPMNHVRIQVCAIGTRA